MRRLLVITLLALAVVGLTGCQDSYDGRLVLRGKTLISSGEVLSGDLAILGGEVRIAPDARVTGSVYLLDGTLDVEGQVSAGISSCGGAIRLGPSAQIGGDLDMARGTLDRAPTAHVAGRIKTATDMARELAAERPPESPGAWLLQVLVETLAAAALAYACARILPRRIGRISRALRYPALAAAEGVLSGLVIPSLLVMMAFTIILIPLVTMGLMGLALALALGWIACGLAFGTWLSRWCRWRLDQPGAAAAGTFLLTLAVNVVGLAPAYLAWISIVPPLLGLGAILVTQLGTREYAGSAAAANEESISPV